METEPFILRENDWLPNNERLPVLLFAELSKLRGKKAAERFERMFAEHGCHRAPRPQTEAINVRLGFARSSRWRTTIESALKIEMERPFTPN